MARKNLGKLPRQFFSSVAQISDVLWCNEIPYQLETLTMINWLFNKEGSKHDDLVCILIIAGALLLEISVAFFVR